MSSQRYTSESKGEAVRKLLQRKILMPAAHATTNDATSSNQENMA